VAKKIIVYMNLIYCLLSANVAAVSHQLLLRTNVKLLTTLIV